MHAKNQSCLRFNPMKATRAQAVVWSVNQSICFGFRAVVLRQLHLNVSEIGQRQASAMSGFKQQFGLRTVLSGLKRSAKVFFAQAELFNGCDKKRLRA
jgi:hypothetical protein